jgi:hypothetical protein
MRPGIFLRIMVQSAANDRCLWVLEKAEAHHVSCRTQLSFSPGFADSSLNLFSGLLLLTPINVRCTASLCVIVQIFSVLG